MFDEKITLTAVRDYSEYVGNNAHTLVKGNMTTQIKQGNMHIEVQKGTFTVQAKQCIELKVGSSVIAIKRDQISMVSPAIHLNPNNAGSGLLAFLKALTTGPIKPDAIENERYALLLHDTKTSK